MWSRVSLSVWCTDTFECFDLTPCLRTDSSSSSTLYWGTRKKDTSHETTTPAAETHRHSVAHTATGTHTGARRGLRRHTSTQMCFYVFWCARARGAGARCGRCAPRGPRDHRRRPVRPQTEVTWTTTFLYYPLTFSTLRRPKPGALLHERLRMLLAKDLVGRRQQFWVPRQHVLQERS